MLNLKPEKGAVGRVVIECGDNPSASAVAGSAAILPNILKAVAIRVTSQPQLVLTGVGRQQ